MEVNRQNLKRHIMQIVDEIYKLTGPAVPDEWLSSDITVTQLHLLQVLQAFGPLRMSDVASRMKVSQPTASIIVNNLVRKNLVQREANPLDRRVVICQLSLEGQTLIDKLWGSGRNVIEKLLEGLTVEQMQKTAELADLLYQNAVTITQVDQQFGEYILNKERA
jgi:DNA-binding MarR family transcriptional regulator